MGEKKPAKGESGLLPPDFEVETPSDEKAADRMPERSVQAAVKLKLYGATYPEIAETLGYKSAATVRVAVERAIAGEYASASDFTAMRNMTSMRYEQSMKALAPTAFSQPTPSRDEKGNVVRNADGEVVYEPNPNQLAYMREFVAVNRAFAILHGLNAPQISVQVTPDTEAFDRVVTLMTQTYKGANDAQEADVFELEELTDDEEPES